MREKLRRERAKADMDELKLELARGETVKIEYIKKVFGPPRGNIRSNARAMPLRVAKMWVPYFAGDAGINDVAEIISKVEKNSCTKFQFSTCKNLSRWAAEKFSKRQAQPMLQRYGGLRNSKLRRM